MSTQYTPGPWYWISDNALWSEKDGEVIEAGDDGKDWGMHSGEIHHHYDPQVKEANKALIAAAPDMYEALKELYAVVKGECPSLLDEDSGGDSRLALEIESALAKAETKS